MGIPPGETRPRPPEPGIVNFSKETLRVILVSEQGFLCCYCGSRIKPDNHTRLDHVTAKSEDITGAFRYTNLVAACSGGVYVFHLLRPGETLQSVIEKYDISLDLLFRLNPDLPRADSFQTDKELKIKVRVVYAHCDVKKEDDLIQVKPTDADCESRFSYSPDGKVWGADENAKMTIDTLGLNDNPYLFEKRVKAYERFATVLAVLLKSQVSPNRVKAALLNRLDGLLTGGELKEMAFVEAWHIRHILKIL